MGLASVVSLTEAAAFNFGYAMLRTRWFNPEGVTAALAMIVAALLLALLIALTPKSITIDPQALDPVEVWPLPRS